jgi:hypothetical protein
MMNPSSHDTRPGEPRFRCAVPVTLRRKGADLGLLTSEVSFRDAFVRTLSAPPVNSLVRLVFTLPPDGASIGVSAHVISVVTVADNADHYPGFLARFVGLDGPPKHRWETLIESLRGEGFGPNETTAVFAPAGYVALFQRQAPAADDVWLEPQSVEELQRIIRLDMGRGSVFVPSAKPVTPGTNVTVMLVHPVTQAVFPLDGVVRRRGAEVRDGIVVGVAPLTPERVQELTEMADSVLVVEDYDVELYDEPVLRR